MPGHYVRTLLFVLALTVRASAQQSTGNGLGLACLLHTNLQEMTADIAIFIPKRQVHAVLDVTSTVPLKVLSVQTPRFSGEDRHSPDAREEEERAY